MVRETRHLWVGNLPETVREDRIREHFKRSNPISHHRLSSSSWYNSGQNSNNGSGDNLAISQQQTAGPAPATPLTPTRNVYSAVVQPDPHPGQPSTSTVASSSTNPQVTPAVGSGPERGGSSCSNINNNNSYDNFLVKKKQSS